MDAIDRSIRQRLHRAGAEMTARPLRADDASGVHASRSWRPLLAAVGLAVVVGGVAGGVGLHSRLAGRPGGPAATPPPAASTPAPTPAYQAAPFISMADNLQTAWDSTQERVVAYVSASPKTSTGSEIWTWDGRWHQENASGGPGTDEYGIWLDDPGLKGMVVVGGNGRMHGANWLWDGAAWTRLPAPPSQECMMPAQGGWDAHRGQLVVLFSDQCSGGTAVLPTETWTLDGRTWHKHADTPGSGPSAIAWDPEVNAVVLLGPDGAGKARAWTWTGSGWSRGPASSVAFPDQADGAAWDARTGSLAVYAGGLSADGRSQAQVITYRKGSFAELPQDGAPMYTQGVFADPNDGRLLALGSEPVPGGSTPAPYRYGAPEPDYFVITWTGTTWIPVRDLTALRTP
jgi:hypothetical protein